MKQSPPGAFAPGVVLLAAGASRRMGRPKLLLPWGATSVLGHLVQVWQALGAAQVAVVRAPEDRPLELELDRLDFPAANRISNPAPDRGMFSSIQCAAGWPGWEPRLTHWAIVLGDQPHLRRQTLQRLLDFSAAHPAELCQPSWRGRGRHPVILTKPAFQQLRASAVATLKEFLAAGSRPVILVEADDLGLDLDIDRPEDYEAALQSAGLRSGDDR